MNLRRWRKLIGSLSLDIRQYPMMEISNSDIVFIAHDGRLVTLIKTNKPLIETNKPLINPGKKYYLVYFCRVHL